MYILLINVCTFNYIARDQIKDDLNPKIWRLENYLESFGDSERHYSQLPSVFEVTVHHFEAIRTVLSDLEMKYDKLKSKIQIKAINSSITLALRKRLENLHLPYGTGLEHHESWRKSYTGTFDTLSSILGLVNFSPITAIVLLIPDLIISIKSEENVKQQLKETISKLITIKRQFEEAKKSLENFKHIYHSNVIPDLKRFMRYVKNDFPRFWRLLGAMSYAKINMRSVSLVNSYLQKVTKKFKEDDKQMQNLLLSVFKYEEYISSLSSMIDNGYGFDLVYKVSNQIRERKDLPRFETKFDLLRYIANNIMNNSCYWGMDLDRLRTEEINENDWSKLPVCFSSELQNSLELLKSGVTEKHAPCRLFQRLDEQIFDNVLKLLRFLAEYVIPNESCYWGYNIESIRKMNKLYFDSNFPLIDSNIIIFLRVAEKKLPTKKAIFDQLCKMKVCIKSEEFKENLLQFASSGQCGQYANRQNSPPDNTTFYLSDNRCYY